jgi:poly(3-hydroxybutyrate) depolymerase
MKWLPLLFSIVTIFAILAPAGLPAAEPPEFQKREFAVEGAEPLKYVVYVPAHLSADKPVPFLIFLHGRADDCITHERILKESNLQFWHGYDRDVQREPTLLL